jgi:hypothetical protein
MQSFPSETVEGFVEPNDTLAETIKIQASAVASVRSAPARRPGAFEAPPAFSPFQNATLIIL